LAGFGWLKQGVTVGFRHPRPVFAASALLLLIYLLPSLVAMPLQFAWMHSGPRNMAVFFWIAAGSWLLGLLLVPLSAGLLQVIDAAERGVPARAIDIFAPYRKGDALRLIGFKLALYVTYAIALGGIFATIGRDVLRWYIQAISAQFNHQPPAVALPSHFGITFSLLMIVCMFLGGVYAISLGQVALRRRSVLGAIGDGFAGTLKNLLPMLAFVVGLVFAWILAALCIGIVVAVLVVLGKLVGNWLLLVGMIPLYLALVLLGFTLMFGVMYHLWRDVCEGDTAPPAAVVQSVAA
jgi:hypothetical protein